MKQTHNVYCDFLHVHSYCLYILSEYHLKLLVCILFISVWINHVNEQALSDVQHNHCLCSRDNAPDMFQKVGSSSGPTSGIGVTWLVTLTGGGGGVAKLAMGI